MHLGLYEGIYRLKIIKLTILRIYSVIMLRDFNADNFEFRFELGSEADLYENRHLVGTQVLNLREARSLRRVARK